MRMDDKEVYGVMGGQGRTPEDLIKTAQVLACCVLLLVVLLAVAAVVKVF